LFWEVQNDSSHGILKRVWQEDETNYGKAKETDSFEKNLKLKMKIKVQQHWIEMNDKLD
jgi:hypothetical protein